MKALQDRLDRGEVIILDGGTGTELERRGVPMDGIAWSAAALETHPVVVRQVHEDYIRAGADIIIIINIFSTARHVLEAADMGERVRELNTRAATLAREARDEVAADRSVYVAGSISTFSPGLRPELNASAEQAKANYREQAHVLAEAGVALIILEMLRDLEQLSYAIEAAATTDLPTWLGFSCELSANGSRLALLDSQGETFAEALESLSPLKGSLVSVMHTEVEDTESGLQVLRDHWSGPLGAYAHSGEFVMPNWQFENIISPQDYLSAARRWVEAGVQLIGGCCGIRPDHIRLLKDELPAQVPGR